MTVKRTIEKPPFSSKQLRRLRQRARQLSKDESNLTYSQALDVVAMQVSERKWEYLVDSNLSHNEDELDTLISDLGTENWQESVDNLYQFLKPKMQGSKGAIKALRNIYEDERKSKLSENDELFLNRTSLDGLDEQINIYTKRIFEINSAPQRALYHNYFISFLENEHLERAHPECFRVAKLVLEDGGQKDQIISIRLATIMNRITVESGTQSNKSNAGVAGENFVQRILDVAGLKNGVHYREQYKSKAGSDTDFVFPAVEDLKDYDVQIFLAVQFSSNDRTRLASSELKAGAECYLLTGNGLDVSTKKLKDIGKQIIQKCKDSNHKLICYGPEIKRELERLKNSGIAPSPEIDERIDYFENYAISIEHFAKRLRDRFILSNN